MKVITTVSKNKAQNIAGVRMPLLSLALRGCLQDICCEWISPTARGPFTPVNWRERVRTKIRASDLVVPP